MPKRPPEIPKIYGQLLEWAVHYYHAIMQIPPGEWAKGPETTEIVAGMDRDIVKLRDEHHIRYL